MNTRLEQLDTLRGIAALSVVVCHCLNIASPFAGSALMWWLTHTPLAIVRAGHEAVVFFFVLSGFVLAIPLLKRPMPYLPFIVKRAIRIYLPYYAAIALALLLMLTVGHGGIDGLGDWFNRTWTTPVSWSMVVNHLLLVTPFRNDTLNTAIWSLVHEMRVSLFFPLIVLLVLRRSWRYCLGTGLALTVAAVGVQVVSRKLLPNSPLDLAQTMHYTGFFILGALMAQHREALAQAIARRPKALRYALLLLAVLLYTSFQMLQYMVKVPGLNFATDWLVAAGSSLFLLLALASGKMARVLTLRPLHFLGVTSYSVYLFHGSVLFGLVYLLYGHIPLWGIWALTLAGTIGLAALAYHAVEVPSINIGRALAKRMMPADGTPDALTRLVNRVMASSIARRLLTGAFWSTVSMMVARGLTLAAAYVSSHLLGKVGFGELGIIQNTVGTFGAIAGFGLGLTATKYVAELRQTDPARAGRVIGLSDLVAFSTGLGMALLLVIFAPWLAAVSLKAPHLAFPLRLGALMIFFGAMNGALSGALAGFEAFRETARTYFISAVVAFPVIVCGLYFFRLPGVICGLGLQYALNALLQRLALQRIARAQGVPITYRETRREAGILWRFSIPAALSAWCLTPVTWICNTMLVRSAFGYADMGIFNAANQWRMAILFIPITVGQAIIPMLSNLRGVGDRAGYRKLNRLSFLVSGGVSLLVAVVVILLSPILLGGYGNGFIDGKLTFIILIASTVIIAVNNAVSRILISTGKMLLQLGFDALWGAASLVSALLLIPRYGAMGLALSVLIAAAVQGMGLGIFYIHHERRSAREAADAVAPEAETDVTALPVG